MENQEDRKGIALIASLLMLAALGLVFGWLFTWHDNGGWTGTEIDTSDEVKEAAYYPDGNGWLLSYGWDDPSARPRSIMSDYMLEATLIVNFKITKGTMVLRIFDENGNEVFNRAFSEGTYENQAFPLGELGHGYSDTDKITVDFEGTGGYEIHSRSKGYDRITNRGSGEE